MMQRSVYRYDLQCAGAGVAQLLYYDNNQKYWFCFRFLKFYFPWQVPVKSTDSVHVCVCVCVCVCVFAQVCGVCVCVCLHRCVCMCVLHLLEGERLCNKFYQECEYVQTPEMECVLVCFIVIKFCICSSIFCALMRPLYSLYANPLLILWIYVQVLCHLDGSTIFDLYYLLWVICA